MKKLASLLCMSLLLSACGARAEKPFDYFAQCLTDKGVKMYGSDSCPHCKAQKEDFKGSFDLVDYIECGQNPLVCQNEGISAYPTWEIDGEKTSGRKSLSSLAEESGCQLRPDTAE